MAFHEDWLARADDPTALDWLCETFAKALPSTGIGKRDPGHDDLRLRYAPVFQRLEALTPRGPDVRIAEALTRFVESGKLGGRTVESTRGLYEPLLDALLAQASPTHVERIRRLVAAPTSSRATVRAYLAQYVSEHLGAAVAVEPDAIDGLWATVYANPDDVDAKRILADQLVERDDPRGHYMALTFDDPYSKPAEKLLRKHRKAWLGPDLASVLVKTEFRDGFLHSAGLGPNTKGDAATWARAVRDPRLATLRVLRHSPAKRDYTLPFLQLPQVLRIEANVKYLSDLAARPPGLRELDVWGELSVEQVRELTGPGTEALRTLEIGARRAESLEVAKAVLAEPWCANLTELRFDGLMAVDGVPTAATNVFLEAGWSIKYRATAFMIFAR
jgi:hypothetical protein